MVINIFIGKICHIIHPLNAGQSFVSICKHATLRRHHQLQRNQVNAISPPPAFLRMSLHSLIMRWLTTPQEQTTNSIKPVKSKKKKKIAIFLPFYQFFAHISLSAPHSGTKNCKKLLSIKLLYENISKIFFWRIICEILKFPGSRRDIFCFGTPNAYHRSICLRCDWG